MRKLSFLLIIVLAMATQLSAQDLKADPVKQFLQINTVESVVSGGFGRSKMIITYPDGSQKEAEMENLFSLTGINFKNIKENEDKIVKTLKSFTDDGWKVDHVVSLTLSQNDNGAGGIFMTRYLLSKPITDKKAF